MNLSTSVSRYQQYAEIYIKLYQELFQHSKDLPDFHVLYSQYQTEVANRKQDWLRQMYPDEVYDGGPNSMHHDLLPDYRKAEMDEQLNIQQVVNEQEMVCHLLLLRLFVSSHNPDFLVLPPHWGVW